MLGLNCGGREAISRQMAGEDKMVSDVGCDNTSS